MGTDDEPATPPRPVGRTEGKSDPADPRLTNPEARNSPRVEARDESIKTEEGSPTVAHGVVSDGELYETPASRRSLLPHLSMVVIAIVAVLLLIALLTLVF
ncbi:MAG TPA: hypothetical protein PKB10_05735 [Tepidisphaeraceae bacterium]|nr:hypothetical protein [Tepidisphaeraceae bacterium]